MSMEYSEKKKKTESPSSPVTSSSLADVAHHAASEGARVSILARSAENLEESNQSIKLATGVEVATFPADVRDYNAVSKAIDESGPIDVLIVNQGMFTTKEIEKLSPEDVKFTTDVKEASI